MRKQILHLGSCVLFTFCGVACPEAVPQDAGWVENADAGLNRTDGGPVDTGTKDAGVARPDAGPSACNNGILEPFEACEGFEVRGETCETQGFSEGRLSCSESCTLDTSACTRCGNDLREGDEICDGEDAPSTCSQLLGEGYVGAPTCNADCSAFNITSCRSSLPPAENEACDVDSTSCAEGLECLETSFGNFCLERCDSMTTNPCGEGRFCLEQQAQNSASICLAQPGLGDVCSDLSGCSFGDCVVTFNGRLGGDDVKTCEDICTVSPLSMGQGSCSTGQSCLQNPGSNIEVEGAGDLSCTVASVDADCDVDNGYGCLDLSSGTVPEFLCARVERFCAEPQPFYGFSSAEVPDEVLCDRSVPTAGGRFCGIVGEAVRNPAVVSCYPLFANVPEVGACVGFCDEAVEPASGTLDCGLGAACAAPAEPQFFYMQTPEVLCETVGIAACDDVGGFDRCVDFGGGLACARVAKICISEGAE